MNALENPIGHPRSRRWWQRPSRLVPVALIAFVLLGVVGFWAASKAGLKREIAAIRAKGHPTNPKELDAWYAKVPPAENAGLKLLEARQEFVASPEGKDPVYIGWREIPHDQRLDQKTIAILEAHLEKNAETLRLMREAAKLKRSRFPTDLSRAPEIDFRHLAPIKGLAQLARWEAILKAERGDAEDAVEALRSGFAVARTMAQEPLVISELVRIACVAIQLVGMERVVNVAGFNEAQLDELIGIVRETIEDCSTSLTRSLIGERAFANLGRKYSFEEYEQMVGLNAPLGVLGGGAPVNSAHFTSEWPEFLRKAFYYTRRGLGMHDRDHAYYIRSLGRIIDATTLEHPKLHAETEAATTEIVLELNENPLALELSNLSLSAIMYMPRKEVQLVARLRCAEATLQIERWRRANGGRLPKEEELASHVFKEIPTDPLDGKPLKYERLEGSGYRMIAVESSAKDRESKPTKSVQEIAFEVVK